jgi:dihydrofolate reductase
MPALTFDISMSLDGFIAGPNQTLEQPLGEGGEQLHEWVVRLASWRERHGMTGGETGPDDEVVRESMSRPGAFVMGRRMFSGGQDRWEDDPNSDGWWGEDPPFGVPVFVLTHHPRDQVEKQGGTTFTFVRDGADSALEQARAAAGDKDIQIAGGASIVQQYLEAGLVDDFQIHVVPVLLADGVRLFGDLEKRPRLELARVVDSPAVTHLSYRVVKD